MSNRIMLTAAGQDRPGIVAAVTRLLYEHGCNLEDSSMTRLEGEFAMILIVYLPADAGVEKLRESCADLGRQMDLTVYLKELKELETKTPPPGGEPHIISLYGADRPGLVYRVADLLARQQINITDVMTHRTDERDGSALYQLLLEVEIPSHTDVAAVDNRLQDLAEKMRVEITLRAMDPVEL